MKVTGVDSALKKVKKQIERRRVLNEFIKTSLFLIMGIFSASLGIKGFLLPNYFIDGGVTGISMLIRNSFGVSMPLVLLIVNIPFVYVGYKQVGKVFAFRSAMAILGLACCIALINFPEITNDKLLSAVFGGIFLGAGIGFTLRGGGVLDGTEIMALIVSRKLGITVGDVILLVNVIIFGVAAFSLGMEVAMYSMLTYFSASKTVDFLIHGIEEYIGITIISNKSREIKEMIIKDMSWGVTVYKGKRGLTEIDQDILFCTVTRFEIPKFRRMVEEIDSNAFMVLQNINDTSGGVIRKKFKNRIPHKK